MTSNLARRLNEHRTGKGSPYTKRRMPVTFLGALPLATQRDALQVENILWRIGPTRRIRFAEAHGLLLPEIALDYDDAFELSGRVSWYEWVVSGAYDTPLRTTV